VRIAYSIAVCIFALSFSSTLAQTDDVPKKNCAPPRPTYSPSPRPSHYPQRESAVVTLSIVVDEKGRVGDPKVVRSSGYEDFDHDAIDAVRRWKFEPSKCDGQPVSARIAIEIDSHVHS